MDEIATELREDVAYQRGFADGQAALRARFLHLLTVDGPTADRRRKDYNQAVFFPLNDPNFAGHSIWSSTDLYMVMSKFDRAAHELATPC